MAEHVAPRTRLEQLLRQQHVTLEEFRKNYQRAAQGTILSERQAYRWVAGELRGLLLSSSSYRLGQPLSVQ